MSLKVLLYKDKSPTAGDPPGIWPAFVNPIKEGEVVTAPWIQMSEEEYNAYRVTHRAVYDAWDLSHNSPKEAKIRRVFKQCRDMKKEVKLYENHAEFGLNIPDHITAMIADCNTLDAEIERLQNLEVGGTI